MRRRARSLSLSWRDAVGYCFGDNGLLVSAVDGAIARHGLDCQLDYIAKDANGDFDGDATAGRRVGFPESGSTLGDSRVRGSVLVSLLASSSSRTASSSDMWRPSSRSALKDGLVQLLVEGAAYGFSQTVSVPCVAAPACSKNSIAAPSGVLIVQAALARHWTRRSPSPLMRHRCHTRSARRRLALVGQGGQRRCVVARGWRCVRGSAMPPSRRSSPWRAVRERRRQMHRTWPGGKGKRGFSKEQGSRQKHFPTHLLAASRRKSRSSGPTCPTL
jgi:hypothetical protein